MSVGFSGFAIAGRRLLSTSEKRRSDANVTGPGAFDGQRRSGGWFDGGVVYSGLRVRPRYFDGKFLTAADLTRDQDYMRQRQADLARVSGTGVISGLEVAMTTQAGPDAAYSVDIGMGHGVTPSGDVVSIGSKLTVKLADLAATRMLDSRLGLRIKGSQAIANREGLFILALRAVEFTANPVSAYPTSLDGPRSIENGDIVEATAVTLIPYPYPDGWGSLDELRGIVARDIFVKASEQGDLQDALPLAMLALDRGVIRWIDSHLVRRETGADTPLQVSMGGKPRALAEAYVLQHAEHFMEEFEDRKQQPFAASDVFAALPAAGRLPAASVAFDNFGFLQSYFPPSVDVELSFVAADELAALVEESLVLPPIDLRGNPADLDATGVIILAPVQRPVLRRIRDMVNSLPVQQRSNSLGLARRLSASPASLLTMGGFRPRLPLRAPAAVTAPEADAAVAAWRGAWALAEQDLGALRDGTTRLLWYVRRRTVPYRARLEGRSKEAAATGPAIIAQPPPPQPSGPATLRQRLAELEAEAGLKAVLSSRDATSQTVVEKLLNDPRILRSRTVVQLVINVLLRPANQSPARTSEIALQLARDPIGLGLLRLAAASGKADQSPMEAVWLASLEGVKTMDDPDNAGALQLDRQLTSMDDQQFKRAQQVINDGITTRNVAVLKKP
jgi:hypothetical protein